MTDPETQSPPVPQSLADIPTVGRRRQTLRTILRHRGMITIERTEAVIDALHRIAIGQETCEMPMVAAAQAYLDHAIGSAPKRGVSVPDLGIQKPKTVAECAAALAELGEAQQRGDVCEAEAQSLRRTFEVLAKVYALDRGQNPDGPTMPYTIVLQGQIPVPDPKFEGGAKTAADLAKEGA